jgi:hypothetical protein
MLIEIIDIECSLGHRSCLHLLHGGPYIAAILNSARSEWSEVHLLTSINKVSVKAETIKRSLL